MAIQAQCDDSADKPEPGDEQSPESDVEVRNTVTDAVVYGSPVQARTVTGGVHIHDHRALAVRPVPRQLPPAPNGFVGRADYLADLDIPSTGQQEASMVVISAIGGTGGIGKTWLALTWAHRNQHLFPDGQLFVDLHGFSPTARPAHPGDVLGGFLDALGVDRDRQPTAPDRRADLYRSLVAEKRMLVLLDNAATADQITPLLPGGRYCTVVITSRNRLGGLVARHGARPVHLDVLTDAEAHTLLVAALGLDRASTESRAIADLVGLCGGFPLALGLVAARITADCHLPLGDTVTELRALGLDALDSEDPTASLSTVLSWSLRHLNKQQRTVLALLGIAPGPDISMHAVASLTDLSEREAHAVLRGLVDASLIDRTRGNRYTMHDLVRAYATHVAAELPPETREAALQHVLDFYTHTAHIADRLMDPHSHSPQLDPPIPGVHPQPLHDAAAALAWFDTEHACLLAAQHTASAHYWYPTVCHLAWGLNTFHFWRGHRHNQLSVWLAAAHAATHLPDPTTRSLTHRRLGVAYTDIGHYEDALAHLHQALTLAEHHDDLSNQAHTHLSIARAWEQHGSNHLALHHSRRALGICRRLNQPVEEARALNSVGWCAALLGDYDTARDHCQTALALSRHHHDPDGEAYTLDSLGYIDHHSGRPHLAIDHYHRALAQYRDLGNTYEAAGTLDRLGHPCAAVGQHQQAHAVWREALQLYQEQGRDDDAARVQRQLDELGVQDRDSDQDAKAAD